MQTTHEPGGSNYTQLSKHVMSLSVQFTVCLEQVALRFGSALCRVKTKRVLTRQS
jgi:hypothetical protein